MTMQWKIEKNMPMPPAERKRTSQFHYMEVGDSVFIPRPEGMTPSKHMVSYPANYAHVVSRRKGKKFSCRTEPDGLRIWRTA